MSVALYMDENVPRQIAVGLRLRDIDVLTVQEDNRAGMLDSQVLARATDLQRVLFSRDDDVGVYFPKATVYDEFQDSPSISLKALNPCRQTIRP